MFSTQCKALGEQVHPLLSLVLGLSKVSSLAAWEAQPAAWEAQHWEPGQDIAIVLEQWKWVGLSKDFNF